MPMLAPREHLRLHNFRSVERRWKWLILLAITTFGGTLLGVVLIGWIGVIVGLVLAIISWKIGPLAKTKARDTDHY